MKKKIFAMLLVVGMIFTAVGCAGKGGNNQASPYADATEVLTTVWNNMGEVEYPVFGGNFENSVENAPGNLPVTDTDTMTYTLLVPADVQEKVTSAATVNHMMNANIFTGATLQLDGMDAKDAAEKIKESFLANQFMCGVPDKLIVVTTGNFVVFAYGATDNVDAFKEQAGKLDGAQVVVDQPYL
ncbi:MAG: hypothetical protein PUD20_07940 [bacterium]|nr:hypothetical protein [bacterium]